ncbi:MAG: hypothetical protein WC640_01520 [Candidatus Paceibacterota bacterium]|jgi:hypothetical protein
MRYRLSAKRRKDFWTWFANWMGLNAGGVFRLAIGSPIEWLIGLPPLGIAGFRFFSWVLDSVLAYPFGLIREGVYDLEFVDRENFWHKTVFDTISISVYKDLSYAISLWLWMDVSRHTFWTLFWINVGLFVVTGAANCYCIDVFKRSLPDLTPRILAWAEIQKKKFRRKKK